MLSTFNFLDFFSAFIVLFAVIDPIGAIPIVISVREQGRAISAFKAVLYSFVLMVIFFFMGEGLLQLFGVDINSFAVAGSLVLFLLAMEKRIADICRNFYLQTRLVSTYRNVRYLKMYNLAE